MKLQYLIQQHQSELSELDRGILNYILSNGDTVLSMGIVELSEQVHVSKSSILRLTKKLGFSGYSEFKYFLRHQQEQATTISQQKTIFE
ncbi:MurR/RpiR family transcriptional regulator, partial [Listeria monocytogenes]|nr:MurR/RpiR family transcriptional regulator [Listeria monocytogenes]